VSGMNKPPIYPKGYEPDHIMDTSWQGFTAVCPTPTAGAWPAMLGLLTIIGDAVRGCPWGEPKASPVLPEVGSVWLAGNRMAHERPYARASIVRENGKNGWVALTEASKDSTGRIEWFLDTYVPATVIPTPTTDGWRSQADEQPAEGQLCWWHNPAWPDGHEPEALTYYEVMHPGDRWVWQPVPPGVIPPPPADPKGMMTGVWPAEPGRATHIATPPADRDGGQ
jgi:hypothetical protein